MISEVLTAPPEITQEIGAGRDSGCGPSFSLLLIWSGPPLRTSISGRLSATKLPQHHPPQISSPRGPVSPRVLRWQVWATRRKSISLAPLARAPARSKMDSRQLGLCRGKGSGWHWSTPGISEAAALQRAGTERKREGCGHPDCRASRPQGRPVGWGRRAPAGRVPLSARAWDPAGL